MIALVNNFHPRTGIGKYAFGLLKAFLESGKEAEMFYFESKDNAIGDIDGVKKLRQGFGYPFANRTLSSYYSFPKRLQSGYELYHASSQYLARSARFRKPCIITHMDLAPLLFPDEYPRFLRFFVKRMLKCYSMADMILTISDAGRDELLKYMSLPSEKVKAIPPGVDTSLYKPMDKVECRRKLGLPEDKKIILNVGSEEPRKNIPLLLAAQRSVQTVFGENVLLVRVGGKNSGYESLKQGLNIMHFSDVSEERMPLFYNSADVFVFPTRYEGGFAYPPLEAMACGIPTVATKALEIFSEGVFMLPFDDKAVLADIMKEILSSPAKSNQLSKRALELSRKFTLKKEAERTWKAYQEVLETS